MKAKDKYNHHLHIYVSDEQKEFIDKMRKEGSTNTSDIIRIMIDTYIEHRKYMRGES